MTWNELVKLALLGTDRAQMPSSLAHQLQALGIDTDEDIPTVVLQAAACYSSMNKAGQALEKWTTELPAPLAKTEEQVCSLDSSVHLSAILKSEDYSDQLLSEFLAYLVHFGQSLPPENLPDILNRALKDRGLWEKLSPAIGERGHWLIKLNPAFREGFGLAKPAHWETGTKEERLAIIRQLRQDHPAKVPELLAESWSAEDHTFKKELLDLFMVGLSPADEGFLESGLDDRRKEVRTTAAKLLAQIPESDYAHRMFERTQACLELDTNSPKEIRPIVQLPEKCGKEMVRDGIDPRQKWSKAGLKASRLLQMLGLVAPSRWEVLFGKSIEQLIPILARGEWGLLLIQGLIDAAALQKNLRWTEALVKFWIRQSGQERWQELKLAKLLENLDNLTYNTLSIMALKKSPDEIDGEIPATQLLKLPAYHWEDKLSMLAIKQLKTWITNEQSSYWQKRPYDGLLANAAYSVHPRLYKYFNEKWPKNDYIWASRHREVNHFLSMLKFRKDMIVALEKNSSPVL